LATPQITNN